MSTEPAKRYQPASGGSVPPAVILVRPQHPGNIGGAARAMANMGLECLHLVEPAPALDATARALAVGAAHILDAVERHDSLATALGPFQRAVGTTSGRNRQLEQRLVTARELAAALADDPVETVALVFGPEASGLRRDEIALLDPLVTIPCSAKQPTLNLAQAVLLVSYELQLAPVRQSEERPDRPAPAAISEVDQLLAHVEELLGEVGFARDDTFHGVLRDLRQMAARTRPSAREVQIFHGICRRTLNALRPGVFGSE